ncbi:MAG: hypothetical protein EKK29_13685 [Hyphomicrobiales bacterium]|nr:MAG: hypothetical protein EKK29_13685 [Hyphomicrobiales bacterium]
MVAFAKVLAELGNHQEETGASPEPSRMRLIEPFLPRQSNISAAPQAHAVYQRLQEELAPRIEDEFPKLLMEARHSAPHLRALRRRFAWRLHPDREKIGAAVEPISFSEVNAAIDAALANCSFNGPRE